MRRRFRIREVQAWELEQCACLASCRVLPIFKSFDPRHCEHVHRCYECLKPAKNQTPTADELHGKKRHKWMDTEKFSKKALTSHITQQILSVRDASQLGVLAVATAHLAEPSRHDVQAVSNALCQPQ